MQGFQEGDKVYIKGDSTAIAANNGDSSVALHASGVYVIIDRFKEDGRAITFTESLSASNHQLSKL